MGQYGTTIRTWPLRRVRALPAGTDTPDAAARALRDRYPRTEVVLTLGTAGLVHIGANGASTLPAFAAQAVDETAAGWRDSSSVHRRSAAGLSP